MVVEHVIYPDVERTQLLRCPFYPLCYGTPVIMLYIIRYNTYYMVALLGSQTYGKHVGVIVYFIKNLLNLFSARTRHISPVV